MKIPVSPPPFPDLKQLNAETLSRQLDLLLNSGIGPTDAKGRYLHWDKLRHLEPPAGYTPEWYWHAMRSARIALGKSLPFSDKAGRPFAYCLPDSVIRDMLWISEHATGSIRGAENIRDASTQRTYLVNTLIEEAISSSQLEGAATTRRVAKEMIRTGRAPQNHSEKMIFNNYRAMAFIREMKEYPLTPTMVFELHRILTDGTLSPEDAGKAGAFRESSDDICVFSLQDELLHVPPRASELPARLQRLCDFANDDGDFADGKEEQDVQYIPPVIRAIIVHFMLGYDHPFVDGNGRTARALFYWVMSRQNFWLMEYLSISRIIKKAQGQYLQAFLHTETDANDATYFIIHQLAVIKEAINDLHDYLAVKTRQQRETEAVLEHSRLRGLLNVRQISLLRNALKNPGAQYTIRSHQTSHDVAYQTSRTDLLDLSDKYRVLKKFKSGKTDVFIAPPDLRELITRHQ